MTIESGADFGRTRRSSGTVTRRIDTKVLVGVQSIRGVPYVQEFSLRNGWRTGRGSYAALVQATPYDPVADVEQRRQQDRIDALSPGWSRNRADIGAPRVLHNAISERLAELQPTTT